MVRFKQYRKQYRMLGALLACVWLLAIAAGGGCDAVVLMYQPGGLGKSSRRPRRK